MLQNKRMNSFIIAFVLLIPLITGCNNRTVENNYYLLLSGESEHWEVNDYKIVITADTFSAGDGELLLKSTTPQYADFYNVEVHAIINHEDSVIQSTSASGSELEISHITIGQIEGGTYFSEKGKPISLNDISDIYLKIEWQNEKQRMEERINLFNEDSFKVEK